MHFQAAIDEFGTATQQAEGWTIVSLADQQAAALIAKAPALLGRGLEKFHGKDFTRKSENLFREFLALLKEQCREGAGSFITCTLNGPTWHDQFTGFAERVLEQSFLKAGVPLSEADLTMVRKVVPPLFTYLRVASHVGNGHTVAVTLDDSQLTKQFNTAQVTVKGKALSLPYLTGMLYRAYRKQMFPSSPEVVRDEIRTAPDETSPLVQAADVVGNFSTAYVFRRLGKESKANDLKADIFHDVFGEFGIDGIDHAASIEIDGEDLRLKQPGAYTFAVA
ncbi:MAG: hypothetical protein GXY83_16715 [Rhodopirellula sp.]|nr:hypothetical protein [Rhodopirellula sp.]